LVSFWITAVALMAIAVPPIFDGATHLIPTMLSTFAMIFSAHCTAAAIILSDLGLPLGVSEQIFGCFEVACNENPCHDCDHSPGEQSTITPAHHRPKCSAGAGQLSEVQLRFLAHIDAHERVFPAPPKARTDNFLAPASAASSAIPTIVM
jgi:hypothetical protein